MQSKAIVVGIAACTCLAVAAHQISKAGDLNPPPGPVQPTGKTVLLDQSTTLPITISEPGSYILMSNLLGVTGEHGIIIDAADVTIDLNGFQLLGVPGSLDGIRALNPTSGLVIKNGSIRTWDGNGIHATNSEGSGVVSSITVSNSGQNGIQLGEGYLVKDSTAFRNQGRGIQSTGPCTITNCVATFNTGDGIRAGDGSNLNECVSSFNDGDGFDVDRSVLSHCSAINNDIDGITANLSLIDGCLMTGNAGLDYDNEGGSVKVDSIP